MGRWQTKYGDFGSMISSLGIVGRIIEKIGFVDDVMNGMGWLIYILWVKWEVFLRRSNRYILRASQVDQSLGHKSRHKF